MAIKLEEIQRRLEEIEARAAKATPGPWESDGVRVYSYHSKCKYGLVADCDLELAIKGAEPQLPYDPDFIAHTREDVPWLRQIVRELLAQYAAMQEPLEWLASIEECGDGFVVGDPMNEEHAKHCPECQAILAARKALQFEAGRELLDRLDKLERVAEAARAYVALGREFSEIDPIKESAKRFRALEEALAALEEASNEG